MGSGSISAGSAGVNSAPALAPADIEAIERATAAAVAPEAVEELDGWLLAFDSGVVGRAKSAAPLRHQPCDVRIIDAIEARYAAHGLPVSIRLAERAELSPIADALTRRGYRPGPSTLVQIALTADVVNAAPQDGVDIARRPDAAWIAAFVGEGFDPVDGASRARKLARGADSLFAAVREGDVAIGAGVVSFGYGWASLHGMRTAQKRRGERIAARVMSALASEAQQLSVSRMFLQVDAHNDPAIALYRRAGFVTVWRYAYWSQH
jgi:ribosomal protein S18 acetylase RimI-like enzyme